jgi:ketosteroid isomerase-like protein
LDGCRLVRVAETIQRALRNGAILFAAVGLTLPAPAAEERAARGCKTGRAALEEMVKSEYAFADQAQNSEAAAFLKYLAEDSWVLNPDLQPGRATYQAAKDGKSKLEWYPTIGDVAPGGDLGFTTGPWVLIPAGKEARRYGHFLTIWKRDAQCQWHIEIDGGVSNSPPASVEPKLRADLAPITPARPPSAKLLAENAVSRAVADFQAVAQEDGFAAALRTYGGNNDFLFFTDEQSPTGIGAAAAYFDIHGIVGSWKEEARGQSADSTLMYSVGELTDDKRRAAHVYVEIWQYDPKVANWGLRVLLINPLPQSKVVELGGD